MRRNCYTLVCVFAFVSLLFLVGCTTTIKHSQMTQDSKELEDRIQQLYDQYGESEYGVPRS